MNYAQNRNLNDCESVLQIMKMKPVIAQFVARIKGSKIEGQTGVMGTNPTQCHHNGMVLSL
jgi:hypothetical protein